MELMLSRIFMVHISVKGKTSTFIKNKLVFPSSGTEVCVSSLKKRFSNLSTLGFLYPGKLLSSEYVVNVQTHLFMLCLHIYSVNFSLDLRSWLLSATGLCIPNKFSPNFFIGIHPLGKQTETISIFPSYMRAKSSSTDKVRSNRLLLPSISKYSVIFFRRSNFVDNSDSPHKCSFFKSNSFFLVNKYSWLGFLL